MKIAGISGSPRKNQNSEKLIEMTLAIAEGRDFETDRIFLSERTIAPCTACDVCKDAKRCAIDDDMTRIYPALEDADAILVASPVYFGCMSAQLKALFDRTRLSRRHGFALSGKIGGAIAVGGSRNGGQEKTVQAIHDWMHIHGMIVVGDNNHFGGIVHAPVESDEIGMQTALDTINKICDVLEMIRR
ncbi:MAG TPA: flavodoxin family protein [Methanosarcinales archaeon]|nr:flavodoxin family protein [Methanosarcinales archaeon]